MSSKAMAGEGPRIPHRAPPNKEIGDLRADCDDSFERVEARLPADGYPRVDFVDGLTVSVGGADQDFALTGEGFGTVAADLSAKLGGLDMTVQVDPADTTVTLRLASGAGLTAGHSALLHLTVDGVAALPVSLEVVA